MFSISVGKLPGGAIRRCAVLSAAAAGAGGCGPRGRGVVTGAGVDIARP